MISIFYIINKNIQENSKINMIYWLIILLMLLSSILAASQFPIYPDEVADKLLWQRFLITDGLKQSVTPACLEGFLVKLPLYLWPAGIIWSIIGKMLVTGYFSYRLIPISILILLYVYILLCDRTFFIGLLLLTLTLGAIPYALIIYRPEIFFIGIGVFCYHVGKISYVGKSILFRTTILIVLYVMASIGLFMHAKSVYMIPLIIMSAISVVFRVTNIRVFEWFIFIIFILFVFLAVNSAISLHKLQLLSCLQYPDLQSIMNSQALNFMDIVLNSERFFSVLKKTVSLESIDLIINQISLGKINASGAFPPIKVNFYLESLNFMIISLLVYILAVTFILFYCLLKNRNRNVFLIFLFCVSVVVPSINSQTKAWYDVAYMISGISISCILCSIEMKDLTKGYFNIAFCLVGTVIVFLSLCANFILYTTSFINGYRGPSMLNFESQMELSKLLVSSNSWSQVGLEETLVVDDLTYDLLSNHRILIPITYLAKSKMSSESIPQVLGHYGVRHGLVGCQYSFFLTKNRVGNAIEEFHLSSGEKVCLTERIN